MLASDHSIHARIERLPVPHDLVLLKVVGLLVGACARGNRTGAVLARAYRLESL